MRAFQVLSIIGLLASAGAQADSRVAGCEFHYQVSVKSYVFFSEGSGTGKVICSDIRGQVVEKADVVISVGGLGLGLGEFNISGIAGSVGVLDPREIEGTYAIAEAGVAAGGGVHAGLGFVGQDNGLSFTAMGGLGSGSWGAKVNGSLWTIRLAN